MREDIIGFFEKGIFPFEVNVFKTKNESEEESEEESKEERINKFFKYIEEKSKGINYEIKDKNMEIKDKKENNNLVKEIKNSWSNLKDGIEKMFEDEKEIEQPDKVLEMVKEILDFNKQNQEVSGLKILTPDQMLNRLPITLAQLNAGNNSEKLKNEIKQFLYYLYRSKKT